MTRCISVSAVGYTNDIKKITPFSNTLHHHNNVRFPSTFHQNIWKRQSKTDSRQDNRIICKIGRNAIGESFHNSSPINSPFPTKALPNISKDSSHDVDSKNGPNVDAMDVSDEVTEKINENEIAISSVTENSIPSKLFNPSTLNLTVGGTQISIETGRIGRQANGAVFVRCGDTVIYCTACSGDAEESSDTVPLSVNYQERFSAAGRTSGGYFKREGRPRDNEILISRLIDRPIRPMIEKGFNFDTQLLLWVLSFDKLNSPESIAITAAGAALALSDIPLVKPVAGVRVGLIQGAYVINPTIDQMKESKLDMIMGGTEDAVLMIEGYCDLLTEEELLEAVKFGHSSISYICKEVGEWAKKVGKVKTKVNAKSTSPTLYSKIKNILGDDLKKALQVKEKKPRGAELEKLEIRLFNLLTEEGQKLETAKKMTISLDEEKEDEWVEDESESEVENELPFEDESYDARIIKKKSNTFSISKENSNEVYDPVEVKKVFKELSSLEMRKLIVERGIRSDGRGPTDIRPIEISCNLLPRVHGSALFTRGETQAIVVTTLGGEDMVQKMDTLMSIQGSTKRFYLQYSFPPSSVGETGRVGSVGRREVGHGSLAERALEPFIPSKDVFPYAIRVESTITESNGSSSMASVCGGCLSLLDAGVQLTDSVSGIAMGLILDTKSCGGDGEPLILSDILGSEDALGDMDFKVAGSKDYVSAFQMDIKVEGITIDVMEKALAQAKEGRIHILNEMKKSYPPPANQLSIYAPKLEIIQVKPSKVSAVIGPGGKNIKAIIEESGIDSMEIQDNGTIQIFAKNSQSIEIAKQKVLSITFVPEIGQVFKDCVVKSVVLFGCFVEILPGKEGLVHISELDVARVAKVEDVVSEGDVMDVKVLEINSKGQLRLSRKVLLPGYEEKEKEREREKEKASSDEEEAPTRPGAWKRTRTNDQS